MIYEFDSLFKFKVGDIVRHVTTDSLSPELQIRSLTAVIIGRSLHEECNEIVYKTYMIESVNGSRLYAPEITLELAPKSNPWAVPPTTTWKTETEPK